MNIYIYGVFGNVVSSLLLEILCSMTWYSINALWRKWFFTMTSKYERFWHLEYQRLSNGTCEILIRLNIEVRLKRIERVWYLERDIICQFNKTIRLVYSRKLRIRYQRNSGIGLGPFQKGGLPLLINIWWDNRFQLITFLYIVALCSFSHTKRQQL